MSTKISPLAGKPAPQSLLVDVPALFAAYADLCPDPSVPAQRVAFGTSGHRGSSFERSFNEWHVQAIGQAICDYRQSKSIDGPLYIGIDTHALSQPAFESALEVLAANGVESMIAKGGEFTPTPAVSHAILVYNRGRTLGLADGIVITPSHNPPGDGGIKYNPPNGGPADTGITGWIQDRANALLEGEVRDVRRIAFAEAIRAPNTHTHDFLDAYLSELGHVIDFDVIRGAGVHYWAPIAERYGINLTVVSEDVDPTFRFMTVDWDGKIRMDPSSSHAMQRLIGLKDRYDVAFACDTDHDRHGIVTRSSGLLAPNHYFSVLIDYLFQHRPQWARTAAVGKTLVSTNLIDRVAKSDWGAISTKCRSALSGSSTACSTVRLVSVARKAPVLLFCAKTARSGPPTRTASYRRCYRRKSPRARVAIRANCTGTSFANWASRLPIASRLRQRLSKKPSWRACRPSKFKARRWPARRSKVCSIARRETTHQSEGSR